MRWPSSAIRTTPLWQRRPNLRSLRNNTKATIVHSGAIVASGTGLAIDLQGFASLMVLIHIQTLTEASSNYSLTFSWKEGEAADGSDAVAITDTDRILGSLVVNSTSQAGSVHRLGLSPSPKRYYFLSWTEAAGTATPASITGTEDGTFEITEATNDALLIALDGAAAVPITLTAGAARTAAQIAGEINAALSATIVTLSGQKLVFTSETTGASSSIGLDAVAADAYATLGFTEGTTPTGVESFSGTFSILGVLGHPLHPPVA